MDMKEFFEKNKKIIYIVSAIIIVIAIIVGIILFTRKDNKDTLDNTNNTQLTDLEDDRWVYGEVYNIGEEDPDFVEEDEVEKNEENISAEFEDGAQE